MYLPQLLSGEVGRLRNTLNWSLAGIRVAWREEKSLRQWAVANAFSWITLGYWQPDLAVGLLLVVLGGLVMIVELINSAIEAAVNHTSTAHHPLAGKAKDIASGAVFATAVLWVVTWCLAALFGQ